MDGKKDMRTDVMTRVRSTSAGEQTAAKRGVPVSIGQWHFASNKDELVAKVPARRLERACSKRLSWSW